MIVGINELVNACRESTADLNLSAEDEQLVVELLVMSLICRDIDMMDISEIRLDLIYNWQQLYSCQQLRAAAYEVRDEVYDLAWRYYRYKHELILDIEKKKVILIGENYGTITE